MGLGFRLLMILLKSQRGCFLFSDVVNKNGCFGGDN